MKIKTGCIILLFIAAVGAQALAAEDMELFDRKQEKTSWFAQDSSRVGIKPSGDDLIKEITFNKALQPVWNSHLKTKDLSDFSLIVLRFSSVEDSTLVVALKDIYGTVGLSKIKVLKGGGDITLPLSGYYLQGLMLRYIKSVAFWSIDKNPCTVALVNAFLLKEKQDAQLPRGALILLDAEDLMGADLKFSYSKKWVTISGEHATNGNKSYLCKVPKGRRLDVWGMVQHDWRNFNNIAFDVWLPGDKNALLNFTIKDSWIKGYGNSAGLEEQVQLKPGANSIRFKLSAMKPKENPGKEFNWEFVQQIGWELADSEGEQKYYLDNIRLEGEGELTADLTDIRKQIPLWGFEKLASIDIAGDFKKINIPNKGEKPSLEAGAAKIKVTPPVGTSMSEGRKAEGILDDLFIRAILIKSGNREIAMLVLDTLYFPEKQKIAEACSKAIGVNEENVYMSATHNHNAGAPYASKVFTQLIIDGAVNAVKEAQKSLKPVYAGISFAAPDLNYNRNLKGSDGKFYADLEHRYLDKMLDSLSASKDLYSIIFTDEASNPIATIINYSAHANSMCRISSHITADWPGRASGLIEEETGGICLLVNGAFGNTNAKDYNIDYDSTIKIGYDVAVSALSSLKDASKLKSIDVGKTAGIGMYKVVTEGAPLDSKSDKPRLLPVTAFRMGPVIFIDPGGELFTEYAMSIRKKSALPYVLFSFGNGGYIPTPEIFAVNGYGTKGRKEEWSEIIAGSIEKAIKNIADGTQKRVDEQ